MNETSLRLYFGTSTHWNSTSTCWDTQLPSFEILRPFFDDPSWPFKLTPLVLEIFRETFSFHRTQQKESLRECRLGKFGKKVGVTNDCRGELLFIEKFALCQDIHLRQRKGFSKCPTKQAIWIELCFTKKYSNLRDLCTLGRGTISLVYLGGNLPLLRLTTLIIPINTEFRYPIHGPNLRLTPFLNLSSQVATGQGNNFSIKWSRWETLNTTQ